MWLSIHYGVLIHLEKKAGIPIIVIAVCYWRVNQKAAPGLVHESLSITVSGRAMILSPADLTISLIPRYNSVWMNRVISMQPGWIADTTRCKSLISRNMLTLKRLLVIRTLKLMCTRPILLMVAIIFQNRLIVQTPPHWMNTS